MMPLRWAGRRRLIVAATAVVLAAGLSVPAFAESATAGTAHTAHQRALPNSWVPTGPMAHARSGQTATLLPDGKVLVAGGGTASAELYNPATRTFSPAGRMAVPRTDGTATLLRDGKVLVAGGLLRGKIQQTSAELYDPTTGRWSATGSMQVPRSGQTATLLPNGKVLVAGGGCNGKGFLQCTPGTFGVSQASAELYNPATGKWAFTSAMSTGRQYGTATLLRDGKVLVAGGRAYCDDGVCVDAKSAQLYDPATGTWAATGSMSDGREQHTATLLPNGKVLVAGGVNISGISGFSTPRTALLYDPATGGWSPTASMAAGHVGHSATLLRNGWVLVAGGGSSVAEIYEPQRAMWALPGAMSTARTGQTATLLPNGHVLVTGGTSHDGNPQSTAEEFLAGNGPLVGITPASISFGGQLVGTGSAVHTYRVTNEGSADLVASGVTLTGTNPGDFHAFTSCAKAPVAPGGTCTVSVRFVPTITGLRTATTMLADNAPNTPQVAVDGFGGGPDAWVPVGSMSTLRDNFTATLLLNGKVLVAGGLNSTNLQRFNASAELYNPATRSFSRTGSLRTARALATATLLRDGQVLVAGGQSEQANLASAELYNPATGKWRFTEPMHAEGDFLTSTLLPSGKVLVTGLDFGSRPPEVYDPVKGTWTDTGPMKAPQWRGTATLLRDGEVLVTGGHGKDAELYNPATNRWTATGSLMITQVAPTATLLPGGKVLLAGGSSPGTSGKSLASSELYNPATGTWSVTNDSMSVGRARAVATLLPDGTVLAAGGCSNECTRGALSSSDIYIPPNWGPANSMTQSRASAAATLLPDGNVLVAGGDLGASGPPTRTAELYTPILMFMRPDRGPAGTQVTVSGSNFYAGETVRVLWDLTKDIGHATTSVSGTFTIKVTIPAAKPGKHTVDAVGSRSGPTGNAALTQFTVTG